MNRLAKALKLLLGAIGAFGLVFDVQKVNPLYPYRVPIAGVAILAIVVSAWLLFGARSGA